MGIFNTTNGLLTKQSITQAPPAAATPAAPAATPAAPAATPAAPAAAPAASPATTSGQQPQQQATLPSSGGKSKSEGRPFENAKEVLTDPNFFQDVTSGTGSTPVMDPDLMANRIRNVLSSGQGNKSSIDKEQQIILAMALSQGGSRQDNKQPSLKAAEGILNAVCGTNLAQDITVTNASLRGPLPSSASDSEAVWRTVLALASTGTGCETLKSLTSRSYMPLPSQKTEDAKRNFFLGGNQNQRASADPAQEKMCDLFLKAAQQLRRAYPELNLPAYPSKLLEELKNGKNKPRDKDDLSEFNRLSSALQGAYASLQRGVQPNLDPKTQWNMRTVERDLSARDEKEINSNLNKFDDWLSRKQGVGSKADKARDAVAHIPCASGTSWGTQNPIKAFAEMPAARLLETGDVANKKGGDMTGEQMRTAIKQLSNTLTEYGGVNKDGKPTGQKLGSPAKDWSDAQWRPYIRQQILDSFQERKRELLHGAPLNGQERGAIEEKIVKNLNAGGDNALRSRIKAIINENDRPMTRDVLKTWKDELMMAANNPANNPPNNPPNTKNINNVDWSTFDDAIDEAKGWYGASSTGKSDDKTAFIPNKPTAREIRDGVCDIVWKLKPGKEFSFGADGHSGFTTEPFSDLIFEGMKCATGLGSTAATGCYQYSYACAPQGGVTKDKQATVSIKNTGSELQMFVGSEDASKRSVGLAMQIAGGVGATAVADVAVSAAVDVAKAKANGSIGWTGTTQEGVMIRLPAAVGNEISEDDMRKFTELVGNILDGDNKAGTTVQSRLQSIVEEYPGILVNRVKGEKSETTKELGGSVWLGADAGCSKLGVKADVGIEGKYTYGKTTGKTDIQQTGNNAVGTQSAYNKSTHTFGAEVSANLNARVTDDSAVSGVGYKKQIPLFDKTIEKITPTHGFPSADEIRVTRENNSVTLIHGPKKFDSKDYEAFKEQITSDMKADLATNSALKQKFDDFLKAVEDLKTVRPSQIFEIDYQVKPDLVTQYNAQLDIADTAKARGDNEAERQHRMHAKKLLDDPNSWQVSGASTTEKNDVYEKRTGEVNLVVASGSSGKTIKTSERTADFRR